MKNVIKTNLFCVFLIQGSMLFSVGIVVRSEFPTTVTVTLSNNKRITKKIEASPNLILAKLPTHSDEPHQLVVDAFLKGLYITFKSIEWEAIDGNKIYEVNFNPLTGAEGFLAGIVDFLPTGMGYAWGVWYDAIISKDNKVHITEEKDNTHVKTLIGQ